MVYPVFTFYFKTLLTLIRSCFCKGSLNEHSECLKQKTSYHEKVLVGIRSHMYLQFDNSVSMFCFINEMSTLNGLQQGV